MEIRPVAFFRSPFKEKFGIPRQAGLAPGLKGRIEFTSEFSSPDAVRGLEGFEYIWLVWGFSMNEEGGLTVRPPRLGGNERVGVFASRSPFRPNRLGLSSVRLEKIENNSILVSGADLADGTPIYDIKPYIEYTDSHTDVRCGFVERREWEKLEVFLPENLPEDLEDIEGLVQALEQDPRPHYQNSPEKTYGMNYSGYEIRFRVDEKKLSVLGITRNGKI